MIKFTSKPKTETTKKWLTDSYRDHGKSFPWHWIAFGLCAIFGLLLLFANTRAAPRPRCGEEDSPACICAPVGSEGGEIYCGQID
uniref:Uncharacterized protein n=1 Tax=Candidatus Kentrum sp. UNK TaxID=2126344 RepID=A0A451AQP4_9GAMM|nr:MAG: hypothetical protein BECKUNK1418G_GA0071005_100269 [Candidatus Kentron sp. UNK]VFK68343.1 MAG: hypothetical protein BECKUNK1418H_GA0071006_100169 [Candidatus Kentron sp. UNK]